MSTDAVILAAALILMAAGFLLLGYLMHTAYRSQLGIMHDAHQDDLARLNAVHAEELARVADDAEYAREQSTRLTADNDRLRMVIGAQVEENARERRQSMLLRTALLEAERQCGELAAVFVAPLEIERGAS